MLVRGSLNISLGTSIVMMVNEANRVIVTAQIKNITCYAMIIKDQVICGLP